MQTRQDVAAALGIKEKHLRFVLYGRKLRSHYREFEIPKRAGGTREISAPPTPILWLQRLVCASLAQYYSPRQCVHGFLADRSIVSNAEGHVGRPFVVNIDLQDFFPSIHLGRVRGVFQTPPFCFGREAAEVLAQICCRDDGVLPQGGATSPFISNLICRSLDRDLIEFSRPLKLRYSRYADDLTFSTLRSDIPQELVTCVEDRWVPSAELTSIVSGHSFQINSAKVRVRTRKRRQEVTGLTVNVFPNIPRHFVKRIEGALYAWEKHGYEKAQTKYEHAFAGRQAKGASLENVLRGRLAYVKMVRGESDYLYRRLVRRFNRQATLPIDMKSLHDSEPCRLRNSPPKSRGWATWFDRYRSLVRLLTIHLPNDHKHAGSAFHIGHGVLATAGHNIVDEKGVERDRISIVIDGEEIDVAVLGTPWKGGSGADVGALFASALRSEPRIPTQFRLPECGEDVAAIGFPKIPQRHPALVMHVGTVEALPVCYRTDNRFIQVSFQSGGGLSGGCLIDRAGLVLGIMVENVFMGPSNDVPQRPYGQAVPFEYFDESFPGIHTNGCPDAVAIDGGVNGDI